jgi:hypothetical protein
MFLQDKRTGTLVEILDTDALIDPLEDKIVAKGQSGQEEQDPEEIAKNQLVFPSGEDLPRCWIDSNYRAAV